MSAFLMSKVDIDILVHLYVSGPSDASEWRRPDVDPDELGSMLWQANHRNAAYLDPAPPSYQFAPPGFSVSIIDGLKHCACYAYQTADDNWTGSEPERVVHGLERRLIMALPGWETAPWGWAAADVASRLTAVPLQPREAGRASSEADEVQADPMMAVIENAFSGIAQQFVHQPTTQLGERIADVDPRARVQQWYGFVRSSVVRQTYVHFFVDLFTDGNTAIQAAAASRARHEGDWRDVRVARLGRVIVHASQYLGDAPAPEDLARVMMTLGPPDSLWTTRDAPREAFTPRMLATRVGLTPSPNSPDRQGQVFLASDDAALADVATLIAEDNVRDRVLAVDTSRETLLLVVGLNDPEAVTSVETYLRLSRSPATFELEETVHLRLRATGATNHVATVLTVPTLQEEPSGAEVVDESLRAGRSMPVRRRRASP